MDLVERLRTQSPRLGPSASTDMLRDEAADKIEQMRREIQDRDKVEYALRKEVECLSTALEALQKMKEFYEQLTTAKVKVPGELWASGAAAISMVDNAIAKATTA